MPFRPIHHLGRDRVVYGFDKDDAPLLAVEAPCELMIETLDARSGRLRRADQVIETAPKFDDRFPKSNPATGPIAIKGAEPGDALAVDILGIELDSQGFVIVFPDYGLVRGLVNRPVAKILPVEDGMIRFDRFRFPVRPMIGVLATAPAGEPIATLHVGPHGGNMDNNRIAVGARVHLPVRVPGALFYAGDVHASMGDGEVSCTGVEIGARLHLGLSVIKGAARDWPWVETAELLVATASAETYEAAAETAAREMIAILGQRLDVSPVDAVMLMTALGHLRVNQSCRSLIDTSVRFEFPKLGAGFATDSAG